MSSIRDRARREVAPKGESAVEKATALPAPSEELSYEDKMDMLYRFQKMRKATLKTQVRNYNMAFGSIKSLLMSDGFSPREGEEGARKIIRAFHAAAPRCGCGSLSPFLDPDCVVENMDDRSARKFGYVVPASTPQLLQTQSVWRVSQDTLNSIERKKSKLIASLPIMEWIKQVDNVGEAGIATVVGDAGDPFFFPTKAKWRRRCGCAPYRHEDYNRSPSTWRRIYYKELGPKDWEIMAYNPSRRAEVYAVTDAAIRNPLGKYRHIFEVRKEYEIQKALEKGLEIVTTSEETVQSWREKEWAEPRIVGDNENIDRTTQITTQHVHLRAHLHTSQKLLEHLWTEWWARNR